MNKAFFVGGELDGTFQDVPTGLKTMIATSNTIIPGQGISPVGNSSYNVASYLVAPGVSRRIFVDSSLSNEEVEEKMGFFIADLWDECAEANE